jgi:tetratricopeptide (TPR) repeat protein
VIVVVFVLAVAGAAVGGWWYARESTPHPGPIVLISVDGLRPSRFTTHTEPSGGTAALDALAGDAVVFERAYTHSPLTRPAHASMLAGLLPYEHGVRDEAGFTLSENARPLAELLRNRGFETGAAVSSFLLRPESGLAQGFSYFDAALPEPAGGDSPVVERDGTQTAQVASEWLRSRRGYRFLLFVQVDADSAEETVSQLVTELKNRDLYDQATIVLTADRADQTDGISLEDASLHVPLLIKQPNREGAGRHVDIPVQHIDIVPTILDLVRAPVPSALRGRSLRALLDGGDGRIPDQPIYAETFAARFRFGGQGRVALLTPEFRDIDDSQRRPLTAPADIAASDEDRFAAFGNLGVPGLDGAALTPLTADDEAWVARTHRAAATLVAEKQYAAAIATLRQITRVHPEIAILQYQLGRLLGRVGRFDQAEAAFRAATTLEPDSPYIPLALARVLLRADRLDAARDRAGLAVALAEHKDAALRAAAHEIAARIALARDEAEQAEAHAEAGAVEDPGLPLPQFVRGRLLYQEGRYEKALAAFEEAASVLDRGDRVLEELHQYTGETLARLDRYSDAEAQFKEELRAFPRNAHAYSSLAMLYRATHRLVEAERIVEALVDATRTPDGYDTAARLWMILGEPARAAALRADARASGFYSDARR